MLTLAENKCDLKEEGEGVSEEDAASYAKSIDATLFLTSAKTGQGVEELFEFIAKKRLEMELEAIRMGREKEASQGVQLDATATKAKGGCC